MSEIVQRASRSRGAHGRFYVGRRVAQTEGYVVSLRDVECLRPRPRRGDPGFSWGSETAPGRIGLAFAILGHVTRREPSEQLCARFALEVLASLPPAGFVGCDDIVLWLAAEQRGTHIDRRATRPDRHRRLGDALVRAVRRFGAADSNRRTP